MPVKKKRSSIIQKLTNFTKPKPVKPLDNPTISPTIISLPSTVRRLPTIPLSQPATDSPPLLALNVRLVPNVSSLPADKVGECIVSCHVSTHFTRPPLHPVDRTTGFDGVIILDTTLTGRKRTLSLRTTASLIDACSPHDRLALVTFSDTATTISNLIMCTAPYKQALRSASIHPFPIVCPAE